VAPVDGALVSAGGRRLGVLPGRRYDDPLGADGVPVRA
jgi:hypothetical protein